MNRFKTLTKRRQLTIPKDVMAYLGWSPKDAVELITNDVGDLVVRKVGKVCRICGSSSGVKHYGDIFVCHNCIKHMSEGV